jgi:hypothetical protein
MNRIRGRIIRVLSTWCIGVVAGLAFAVAMTSSAWAVTGAAFTTVDDAVDVTVADPGPHCLNGNPAINCNIYTGKQYVWLNGGPLSASVGDGTYFFAVLVPGGQPTPNDAATVPDDGTGTPKNLSDDFDAWTNRTFTVTGGVITAYAGTHTYDSTNSKIRLMPYSDTTNPGGVYILAICSVVNYPADASKCKYDAFKVQTSETPRLPPGLPLTITKSADGSYDNTYAWTITKDVDKTIVKQVGGSVTFTYTVKVTHDGGTVSNVKVTGTITVTNPNVDDANNTVPVDIDGVTDTLSDGTVCTVTDGGAQTLTAFHTDFAYSCDLGATLPSGELDNTVTVNWSDQILNNATELAAGSADFSFTNISFAANAIDECVNVTDTSGGNLGTACVGDANPKAFTYQRTITVNAGCVSYDNTATFTTNDTGATGSASQTVTVCGPAQTGALTIGFWKGPNGQGLIKTYCVNGANNLGTYLAALGAGSGPFSNAPTSCSSLATYVSGILTAASATDMNKMLKAQMLGTALDVWFSGPGWTSTTVNKIKPPSNFLSHNNLGTFKMDTTAVCPMVDNLSTGTATCKNNTPSTDAVAAGAVPASPMAMQAILDYAATTPSPFNASTSVWYGGNRTLQEILKNIFDQFNNQLAFGSF